MASHNFVLSLLFPLVAACVGDTVNSDADATTSPSIDSAIATCDCPAPSAQLVSFDPAASGLSSDNVQDAVDEVAVSIPADVVTKISVQTATLDNLVSPTASAGADCGGSEGDFLALGGSCNGDADGMTLYSSHLSGGSFSCRWRKTGPQPSTATVTVTCLDLRPE